MAASESVLLDKAFQSYSFVIHYKRDKRDLEKSLQSELPKRMHQNKATEQVIEDNVWIYPFHF